MKGWFFLLEDSRDEGNFFQLNYCGQNSIKQFLDHMEEVFSCNIFKDQKVGVGWVLISC